MAMRRRRAEPPADARHVAVCGEQQFTDQRRVTMTVREFVAQWERANARAAEKGAEGAGERAGESAGDRAHAGSTRNGAGEGEGEGEGGDGEEGVYYLKDWHFTHVRVVMGVCGHVLISSYVKRG
ncbi:unnamed protein product [Closterium sp. Naga37s-1]|nr:unnamed protein product [Closterium sp. Naga37s-1]